MQKHKASEQPTGNNQCLSFPWTFHFIYHSQRSFNLVFLPHLTDMDTDFYDLIHEYSNSFLNDQVIVSQTVKLTFCLRLHLYFGLLPIKTQGCHCNWFLITLTHNLTPNQGRGGLTGLQKWPMNKGEPAVCVYYNFMWKYRNISAVTWCVRWLHGAICEVVHRNSAERAKTFNKNTRWMNHQTLLLRAKLWFSFLQQIYGPVYGVYTNYHFYFCNPFISLSSLQNVQI